MILRIYPQNPAEREIRRVVEALEHDGVVVYPTDSVYAYGCSLRSARGLERLRPEWDDVLDGAEKWLYQGSEETYHKICEEFHKAYGSLGSHKEEWENLGEQLLMFFVYTYFCGAVYDDMVCSKMELALFSVRWIQEFLMVRWLENGKKLSMKDVEEISWRYAREVEHSDDNLNALEDWLFERYAPV